MPAIHVKRGVEFKPELFAKREKTEWLDAVGAEIEKKGVTIKVGEGAGAKDVKNAADLKAAYGALKSAAGGADVQRYVTDLLQALDDVVKPTSIMAAGDVVDLTRGSELSKVLGLADPAAQYASLRTEFGKKPDGAMSVLGVQLSRAQPQAPVRPLDDTALAGKNVIDGATFAGVSTQRGRDSVEVEAVRIVGGLDKDQLHKLIMTTNNAGRTVLQRLQRPQSLAFAVGYSGISLDQMKWDSDSHRVRQMNPMVSLTVESGRIEADAVSGQREVTVGRDTFVDYYQEQQDVLTGKFTGAMLDNHVMMRGRLRIDGPPANATDPNAIQVSRALLQSKIDTAVDPQFGVKSAQKQDIRTDSPDATTTDNIEKSVQTAKPIGFYGSNGVDAIKQGYEALSERGALPDVGTHAQVLTMGTVAVNRSIRGRYHLNETPTDGVRSFFKETGEPKIKELLDLINASAMPAADKAALAADATALLDRSEIVKRATDGLKKLDAAMTVDKAAIDKMWPDTAMPSNKGDVKKREVVARAIASAYGDFAEKIDGAQRQIGGSEDRAVRQAGGIDDLKAFFAKQTNNTFGADALKQVETVGPFLAAFDRLLAGTDAAAFATAIGKTPAQLTDMRKNLVTAHAEVLHRMVEASGTMAQTLWFDSVRSAYCNVQRSGWSNFIIDSFDVTEMYKPDVFSTMQRKDWASRTPLDPTKMLDLTVSNDFQIELGYEKPYTDAVDKARRAVLAPLVMDFALQKAGSGADEANKSTFTAFLQKSCPPPTKPETAANKATRAAFAKEVAEFVKTQLPGLAIDDKVLLSLFRTEDGAAVDSFSRATPYSKIDAATKAQLLDDVATTAFVWSTLLKTQETVAEYRGERVMDLLGDAAQRNNLSVQPEWKAPTASKGEMAASRAMGRT